MAHHLGGLVIELAINVVCLGIDYLISRNKKSNNKRYTTYQIYIF